VTIHPGPFAGFQNRWFIRPFPVAHDKSSGYCRRGGFARLSRTGARGLAEGATRSQSGLRDRQRQADPPALDHDDPIEEVFRVSRSSFADLRGAQQARSLWMPRRPRRPAPEANREVPAPCVRLCRWAHGQVESGSPCFGPGIRAEDDICQTFPHAPRRGN